MTETIGVRLARMEEKFDGLINSHMSLNKKLMGNGKPGFIDQVETRFKNIEVTMAENRGGKKVLGAILGSSVFCLLIGLFVNRFI